VRVLVYFSALLMASSLHSTVLVCDSDDQISLRECTESNQIPEKISETSLVLEIDDGCIKEPGDERSCSSILVRDAVTGGQVESLDAKVTVLIDDHFRTLTDYPVRSSTIKALNDSTIEIGAVGFETINLTVAPGSPPAVLRHGQELVLTVQTKDENLQFVMLALKNYDERFSRKVHAGNEIMVSRFPLGVYDIECRANGYPAVSSRIELSDRFSPYPLTYRMAKGSCIQIPLDFSDVDDVANGVEFKLWSMQPIGPPQIQATGTIELSPEQVRLAEICNVPQGQFELEIGDDEIVPVFFEIQMGEHDVRLENTVLQTGEFFTVDVIDEMNNPVPGATVTFEIGEGAERRLVSRETSRSGRVSSPAMLVAPNLTRIAVHARGYLSNLQEVSPGHVILVLRRPGEISGQVDAKDCDETVLTLFWECEYQENCWEMIFNRRLSDCSFSKELYRSGRYRVAVSSPTEKPFEETVEMIRGEDIDLGLIRLEPGLDMSIKVINHAGVPIEDAHVEVVGKCRGGLTDSDGVVELSCVSEEDEVVSLRVTHEEYATYLDEKQIPFNRVLSVELVPPGRIYGVVLDDVGNPGTGRYVTAVGPSGVSRSALVGGSGSYEIPRLGAGFWQVQTSSNEYSKGTVRVGVDDIQTVELEKGAEARVDFTPDFEIYGRATMNGYDLRSQRMIAISKDNSKSITLSTNEKGDYIASFPQAGAWTVHAAGASSSIDLQPPCPCRIDIDLNQTTNGGSK